jgi:hypothetical protein
MGEGRRDRTRPPDPLAILLTPGTKKDLPGMLGRARQVLCLVHERKYGRPLKRG